MFALLGMVVIICLNMMMIPRGAWVSHVGVSSVPVVSTQRLVLTATQEAKQLMTLIGPALSQCVLLVLLVTLPLPMELLGVKVEYVTYVPLVII